MAHKGDSETGKSDRQLMEESLQRSRRIETRVTMIANHLGVDPGNVKPSYDPARRVVQVKSAKVSLEDVLAVMDDDVMVQVFCGDEFLASICPV